MQDTTFRKCYRRLVHDIKTEIGNIIMFCYTLYIYNPLLKFMLVVCHSPSLRQNYFYYIIKVLNHFKAFIWVNSPFIFFIELKTTKSKAN